MASSASWQAHPSPEMRSITAMCIADDLRPPDREWVWLLRAAEMTDQRCEWYLTSIFGSYVPEIRVRARYQGAARGVSVFGKMVLPDGKQRKELASSER